MTEKMQYTEEQQAVLSADGRIIVSASAGSGKTFVMIERLIDRILRRCPVEKVLALTFTKEAAAQMQRKTREKLLTCIGDEGLSEEQKQYLREQLNALPLADISTIDSFCTRFVRSHFFLAGVDGNFSVLTDEDPLSEELKSRALDEVFSEAYEEAEEKFMHLLSLYYRKKDDGLKEVVRSVHRQIRIRSDYREELERLIAKEKIDSSAVEGEFLSLIRKKVLHYRKVFTERKGRFIALGCTPMADYCSALVDFAEAICSADSLAKIGAECENVPGRRPTRKALEKFLKAAGKTDDLSVAARIDQWADTIDEAVGLRKEFRDFLTGASARPYSGEEQEKVDESLTLASEIALYVQKYDDAYTRLKTEYGVLDYVDTEQLTLALLRNEKVRSDVRDRYEYVYVDEYQDVNPLQAEIVRLISGENLFLVGDVKQAIYAFRGSKSVYFSECERQFGREAGSYSLQLTRNFRSGKEVLATVNRIFSRVMHTDVCAVAYAENPMTGGDKYPDGKQGKTTLHLLPAQAAEPQGDVAETEKRGVYSVVSAYGKAASARTDDLRGHKVLEIIEKEHHSMLYDIEQKRERPIEYADMLVLYRSSSKVFSSVVAYLTENGIPVNSETTVNLFDYSEIRQLTDILSYLDNPAQDVPLCSALLSPLGGLSNDELIRIRLAQSDREKRPFRAAVKAYALRTDDRLAGKLRSFFQLTERYRQLSCVLLARELIARLIAETGLEAFWLSRSDGTGRVERVKYFLQRTEEKNLHEFLLSLKISGYSVDYKQRGGDNAVRVMSMHQSKGLEYPVVILPEADKAFHRKEASAVLYSEKYGIAPLYYLPEQKKRESTLLRELVWEEKRRDQIGGELNLLYVAMTRAKYSLHVIAAAEGCKNRDVWDAKSFADLLRKNDFTELDGGYPEKLPFALRRILPEPQDTPRAQALREAMAFVYPYRQDVRLPVKSSASEIMKAQTVGEETYRPQPLVSEMDAEKNEIGTAYHAFLQYADFSGNGKRELERLCRAGILSAETAKLLSPEKAEQILQMPVFKRLAGATLYREQPFLISLPAEDFFDAASKREVLFQGYIDLLAYTKDGFEIVDYKYSSRGREEIQRHYAVQIALYRRAAARILGIKEETIRTTIVNIERGEEIPM